MLLLLVCLFTGPALATQITSWEGQLVKHLLNLTHPHVRPRLDSRRPVEIRLDYFLTAINDVNEKTQSVSLDGIVKSAWKDEILVWNAADYGNVSVVYLPAELVWTPGLVFENAVGDRFYETKYFSIRVSNDGNMIWETGGPMTLLCTFDLILYPFDVQTCSILMGTWSGMVSEITFIAGSLDFHRYFGGRGEWNIVNSWAENFTDVWEHNLTFSEVHFFLRLKRKSLYHVFSIILPVILLSVLDGLVFVLPIHSAEKTGLSVTVLLAFAVLQISFNENLPSNKDYLTLLEIYIYTFMILSTLTVTVAVLVIRIRSIDAKKPLPPMISKFISMMQPRKNSPLTWTDFAEATNQFVFIAFLIFIFGFTTAVIITLVHA